MAQALAGLVQGHPKWQRNQFQMLTKVCVFTLGQSVE